MQALGDVVAGSLVQPCYEGRVRCVRDVDAVAYAAAEEDVAHGSVVVWIDGAQFDVADSDPESVRNCVAPRAGLTIGCGSMAVCVGRTSS